MDYSALLYDPVFSVIGVPATLNGVEIIVVDGTRRKSSTTPTDSGGVDVRSVGPSAYARVQELIAKGIARDDYDGSTLTFNGRDWTVRNHELTGSPNGEDFGQVLFLLMSK